MRDDGYEVHILFVWLSTVELAIERVRRRVRLGGHDIPETVIRRRYDAGLRNLFDLYRPIASSWRVYDGDADLATIAEGGPDAETLLKPSRWARIVESVHG